MELCLHTGGAAVEFDDLARFIPPPKTQTYTPMGHQELITMVKETAVDLLPDDYSLTTEAYGVSPKSGGNIGDRLFGVLTYANEEIPDMGLSLGLRNSYDQSLSVGLCSGAKVFVCDNLAFVGDVKVARKHTGDLHAQMQSLITYSIQASPTHFNRIQKDRAIMEEITVTDDEAWQVFGLAYGRDIIKPRQLLRGVNAWKRPPQEEFKGRDMWSLYNAFTEALKTSSASEVMDSHIKTHELMMTEAIQICE